MESVSRQPLRLWPGVVIVVLQLVARFVPSYVAPSSPAMFFGMMGSFTVGSLLLALWWLFFSRAPWRDRLGGLFLMVGVHAIVFALAHPSAQMSALISGIPLLCAAFVISLFFGSRAVTIAVVLVASIAWTLVRTEGVTGAFDTVFAWRWSSTAEQAFLASDASTVPDPVGGFAVVESAAWPGFRGRDRDGIVRGVVLETDWSSHAPELLWRRPVGPGWGSFALVGDRLCTQEQRDENEVVACYDATSGEPVWLYAYPARFWEALAGAGPRGTPTYHAGRLYTLGATGILNCLDMADGKPVWTRNIADDTGASLPEWGFASSPLVVDDRVIVHAAGAPEGRATVAYDVATGEPVWFGPASGESYSSPHLATIDGVRQIVMLTAYGAYGLTLDTGEPLWEHHWPLGGGSRVVQPTMLDDGQSLLIGTSFGVGTRRISVSTDESGGWNVGEGWTTQGLKPYYNDLVAHRGTAYGFDGSIMAAIDLGTGERVWKGGRYGNGQALLLHDQDLLLVLSEKGELALVRATAERFEEVARVQVLEGKTWNHPVLADGVVYVRNDKEAAAYRLATMDSRIGG